MRLLNRSLIFAACLGITQASQASSDWVYAVLKGDTLSEFGSEYLRRDIHWTQVQKLNQIRNPDLIRPGQKIRIPSHWLNAQPSAALIVAMTGDVRIQRRGETGSQQLKLTDRLELGDHLSTGSASSITIRFADTSELTLLQHSDLVFDQLSLLGDSGMVDSRMRLARGSAEARVKPRQDARARFEIHTPSAVSAVRGTEFRSTYQDNSASARVEVLTGGVAVQAEGVSQLVAAGFGTRVRQGEAPPEPRALLPGVSFYPVADAIIQRNYNLMWKTLEGATSYRVQLSDNDRFSTLLADKVVEQPGFFLPELTDGIYHLRIRGIDDMGIEGVGSVARLPVRVQSLPPASLRYPWVQPVAGNHYRFSWSMPEHSERWHFQLAMDKQFQTLLHEDTSLSVGRRPEVFLNHPGRYYWRVSSTDKGGVRGAFSDAVVLDVKAKYLILQQDWLADKQVGSVFVPGLPHDRFRVQLAEDPQFKRLISDQIRGPGELMLARSLSARYLRIASVKGDQNGLWGDTRIIESGLNKDALGLVAWLSSAALLL